MREQSRLQSVQYVTHVKQAYGMIVYDNIRYVSRMQYAYEMDTNEKACKGKVSGMQDSIRRDT